MRVNTTSETSNQEIMKPKTASTIPVHCSYLRLADVTSIVPHPKNPNKHGDTQVALLAKIIKHQGWRSPITISKRSGFVVAGHGRLQAAALLQVEQVPVDEQEFSSEADELAHLVADNRIAELAEVDTSVISELLKELGDIDFDMDLTGFDSKSLDELEELITEKETPTKATEANTEPKQSDDDYSLFELVMLHENKLKLVNALNLIKKKLSLETNELALMTLVSSYDSK